MGMNNKWDRRGKEKTDFSKRWLLKKKKTMGVHVK